VGPRVPGFFLLPVADALGRRESRRDDVKQAKCIRDRQEEEAIVSRVDQAKLDKLLAEQDLLHVNNP